MRLLISRIRFIIFFIFVGIWSVASADDEKIKVEICGLEIELSLDKTEKTADITDTRVKVINEALAANVVIPETITYGGEEYTIVSLANAFRSCPSINTLVLPNTIRSIKSYSFYNCTNLKSVELSNALTVLPIYLFCSCLSLEEVVIPSSVTTMEEGVFVRCQGLKTLRIPANVVNIDRQALGNELIAIENIYFENPDVNVYPKELFNIVQYNGIDLEPWNGNPNVIIHVPEESLAAFVDRYESVFSADHFVAIVPDTPPTLVISETSVKLAPGESLQLSASITPQTAEGVTITWQSSDESIVTVSDEGKIKAVGVGQATVKAIAGELIAECQVEVVPINVISVIIKGIYETEVYFMGRSYQATVDVYPENATFQNVIWSCNKPELATVDENGLVKCLGEGEAKITAKVGSVERTIRMQIKPIQLESITLSPEVMDLTVGQEGELTWTTSPDDATYTDIKWQISNDAVAIVQNNVVKAIASGETSIKAYNIKNGIWSNECRVKVKRANDGMLILSSGSITLKSKETFQLSIINEPNDLEGLVWSSDNSSVATVNEAGLVTAVGKGETIIRAVCDDRVGECTVIVNTVDATDIQLSETLIELHPGQTTSLDVIITPEDVTDKTVVWTTDNETVAKVNNGYIEAISEGVAVITARCGDVSAQCNVRVTMDKIDIRSVSINDSEITLEVGDVRQLSFAVYPDNAYYETVNWLSTNENVVSISDDGLVSAVGIGEAFISLSVDAVADMCKIKVVKPQVSGIDKVVQNQIMSQISTISKTIIISNLKYNDFVGVYSVNGSAVYPPSNVVTDNLTIKVPSSGVYIVRINKNATKVAVR